MTPYDAAQSSLVIGLSATVLGSTVNAFANTGNFLLAATDPYASGIDQILTQLGVFAVVIVVFKFMLGRQDARDEKSDQKESEVLSQLRHDIDELRKELAEERRLHNETRQKLFDVISKK